MALPILQSPFSIYPNPTSSIVNIRLPEGETVSEYYIQNNFKFHYSQTQNH